MREIYCVGYTPRAWDPRFLWSMLNGPLYLALLGSCFVGWAALNQIIVIAFLNSPHTATDATTYVRQSLVVKRAQGWADERRR